MEALMSRLEQKLLKELLNDRKQICNSLTRSLKTEDLEKRVVNKLTKQLLSKHASEITFKLRDKIT